MKKNLSTLVKTKKVDLEIIVGSANFCIPEKLGPNIIGFRIIVKKNQISKLKDMIYDALNIVYEETDDPIEIGLEFIKITKKLKEDKIIKDKFVNLGLTDEMKDLEKKLKINKEMFDMSGEYYHIFMSFLNKRINNNPMY